MPAVAPQLIGREGELGAVVGLFEDRASLSGAVALYGEAGIGKTSLWTSGLDAAVARGYRVLVCRTSEVETRLAYAGLADLLRDVVDDVLPEMPPIQRRALEVALLLDESETQVDERAVAAAFLAALRSLAVDRPLCVGVDDLQWLDAASLAALRFALARLDDEEVAAFLTIRGNPPPWLRRTVPETRLETLEIRGLSIGATHELLHRRLGTTFPRPTLIRLWETSGGNPFYALELGGALQRRGGKLSPGDPLPIPPTLEELLGERVDDLDVDARDVCRVVAAVAEPTADLVEEVLGSRADAGLLAALDARILELDGERLRFTHPLLASAVSAPQTPSRRRSLHARLAEVVSTGEERARHLALAATGPSPRVASTLEEAAGSAHARGAPQTAAELAEQALRLTPPADAEDARRRVLLAAARQHAAGDADRAVELLTRALEHAAPGVARAAILVQLAEVEEGFEARVAHYREALVEAEGDDALEATIHLGLANLMNYEGGVERGLAHSESAVRAAARTTDIGLRCSALASCADWRFRAGRGVPRAEMDEALALERTLPDAPLPGGPLVVFSHLLVWAVALDEARGLLLQLLDAARRRQDAATEAFALRSLGFLEWRAGNWAEADRHAAGGIELLTQLGRVDPPAEFPAAIIAAHRGRIDEARARSSAAVARAEAERIRIGQSGHGWVLGFIELSLGDPAGALEHLRRSFELRNTFMREPGMRVELGDLLEALIATGELDEAAGILAEWEPRAAALDRAWLLAILARCRGLLLAARGDLDGAFASFERALAEHERDVDPFSRARTLLALGRTQRRAKKRAAARATLEDALARFETLGAPLWADQTRAELGRIGGRAPSGDALTVAERRIAELVAQGRSNKQVAAALFLTEHSVETALSRIYRKLGIHSRAQLAKALSNS